jgi:hypothetical protein
VVLEDQGHGGEVGLELSNVKEVHMILARCDTVVYHGGCSFHFAVTCECVTFLLGKEIQGMMSSLILKRKIRKPERDGVCKKCVTSLSKKSVTSLSKKKCHFERLLSERL